jgi:hypothetical protein
MAARLQPGDTPRCRGYVTTLISVINRPSDELERRLGYNSGRLAQGWALLLLKQSVTGGEFEFAGYTHLSGGRIGNPHLGNSRPRVQDDLQTMLADPSGFATRFAQNNFVLSGPNRIVKIIPTGTADPALSEPDQYPVGTGIPQWILTREKLFLVAVVVPTGRRYSGGGIDMWIDPQAAQTL